jgi:hypothetical protein
MRLQRLSVLPNPGSEIERECILGAESSTVCRMPRRLVGSCSMHESSARLLATIQVLAQ